MSARLSTHQLALRQVAVAVLAGLALVLVIELPWALAQGRHLGVLSGVAIAAALALAAALATGRDGAPWRSVAAFGAGVIAVWVATRAVPVPGLAVTAGHWTTAPGLAACTLATGCLALAAAGSGVRPSRAAGRGLAAALAVGLALAPGAAALLVALAPGPAGGERAIAGAAHVHAHGGAGAQAAFRPGFGGHAGRYVYPNATPPHLPSWGLALAVGAAAGFTYLAAGALGRRAAAGSAPASAVRAAGRVPA